MKRIFFTMTSVALVVLLAACSSGDADPAPTPTQTTTPAPALPAGALTVGELLSRVETAWPTVRSMRTTFWTTAADAGGTPPSTGMVTVEEAVLPDARRVVVLIDGVPTDEQVAVAGRVYMRGALVSSVIAPMVNPGTWVEIDAATAESNSPISMQVGYLLSPIDAPLADISPETAALEAIRGPQVTIDGRTCEVYAFGDSGSVIQELAIDDKGLPCRLIQRAGGVANVTLYTFDVPGLAITAPDIATPTGGDAGA